MPRKVHLEPYIPGRPCPRCSAEGARPAYHGRPVLAVFGGAPQWPCSGLDGLVGTHMCTRCECGYTWMESVSSEEQATMSFIKTASGQVMGTDERGLERTAALAPGWGQGDEDGLAAENTAADQRDEEGDGPLPVP